MTTWTKMELDEIGKAEELQLTPLQINGSLGNTTTMWVVRVGDDLYVRAHAGKRASGITPRRYAGKGRFWLPEFKKASISCQKPIPPSMTWLTQPIDRSTVITRQRMWIRWSCLVQGQPP